MALIKKNYCLRFKDKDGDCDDINIVVTTARDINKVIDLIDRACNWWDTGNVDTDKWEYIESVLERNNLRWDYIDFIDIDW